MGTLCIWSEEVAASLVVGDPAELDASPASLAVTILCFSSWQSSVHLSSAFSTPPFVDRVSWLTDHRLIKVGEHFSHYLPPSAAWRSNSWWPYSWVFLRVIATFPRCWCGELSSNQSLLKSYSKPRMLCATLTWQTCFHRYYSGFKSLFTDPINEGAKIFEHADWNART